MLHYKNFTEAYYSLVSQTFEHNEFDSEGSA